MKNEKIIVIGDTHGEFGKLNAFINKRKPSIILSVGDFGYWPNFSNEGKPLPDVKAKDTKIYFCDGNHEDHWALKKLTNNEIFPNTFYMKRGSVLTLPDGRNVLFVGGADSYDKEMRTFGINWFPEENINHAEVMAINPNTKIDIVISHTAPNEFAVDSFAASRHGVNIPKTNDCNREALSYILKTFNPQLWYLGHWHVYATGFDCNCRWTALDHIVSGYQWWEVLK